MDFEQFSVGDRITWWSDAHGRGLAPDAPGVRQRFGTVLAVNRGRTGEGPVVALIVARQSIMGRYQQAVRPDYGHRPRLLAETPDEPDSTP